MRMTLAAVAASTLVLAAPPLHGQEDCRPVPHSIDCGQTVSSSLTTNDCHDETGRFYDTYYFVGFTEQLVRADLSSNAFDAFLRLRNPIRKVVKEDDDGGGSGTDAQIVHTLNEHSSQWSLVVTTFAPTSTGGYSLRLECAGGQSPPRPGLGWFDDPQYPDFRFWVAIGDFQGEREPDCQPDTVCVSGALPGRSEVFLRIPGPRPNGFLWPTIVRFTASRVVVAIFQHSSARTKIYTLDAVGPGRDELPGLQDRTGFLLPP
jgi:hypothetical protein